MRIRQLLRFLPAVVLVTGALFSAPAPTASAASCPASQVVFARGTGEPPGPGPVGDAFVDKLRSRVGGKSVGLYAVSYPATDDWPTGLDGIRDADAHLVSMASQCPNTKIVLGGYSQGAAVMGFVTSDAVPDGVDPATVPRPLQPDVAQHVAAVVLFGVPNVRAMNFLGQPPVVIGPLYAGKTDQLCVPDDPICSDGLEFGAHNAASYQDGVVDQGADFAASHL